MKKYHNISVEEFYATMKDAFTEYEKQVDRVTTETINNVAKEGRQYLKDKTIATYNKKRFVRYRPHKYQNCFRTQKIEDGRRIKNTRYQLSHLLEDGHHVANQYGSGYSIHSSEYGTSGKTTKEFKVWEETEEMIKDVFPQKLEENIRKI